MSASAGLAASAATNAAIAADEAANAAKSARCSVTMPTFNPATASIAEKQEYAACVAHVFPSGKGPMIPYGVGVGAGVALLVCIIVGAVVMFRSPYGGEIMDIAMGALCGVIAWMLGGIITGVLFVLFTGMLS